VYIKMDTITDKLLYETEWVSIKETPDHYIYVADKPGVLFLPITTIDDTFHILLREEYCPIYPEPFTLTAITGRIDTDELPAHTVKRELLEETGYVVSDEDILYLSDIYYDKINATPDKLYIVFLRSTQPDREPTTDGTIHERRAKNVWVTVNDIPSIVQFSQNGPLLIALMKIYPYLITLEEE